MKKDSTQDNKRKRKCRAKQAEVALRFINRTGTQEGSELGKDKVSKGTLQEWVDMGPKLQCLDQQRDRIPREQARAKVESDSEESLSERSEPSLK